MMRKLLVLGLVSLGMVSASAFGGETYEERYETSRHNIRITCSSEENCLYQSWNKPKAIGQGKPDFTMPGTVGMGYMRDCTDPDHCLASCDRFTFTKGNVVLEMQGSEEGIGNRCATSAKAPRKVWGDMTIKIDGQLKDHYWVY